MPVPVLREFEKQITAALKNCNKVCLEVDYESAIKDPFREIFKNAAKTAWESGGADVAQNLRDGFLPFCVYGSNTKKQKLAARVQRWSQEWTTSTASPLVASPSHVQQLPTTASSTAAMNSASSTASTSSKHSLSSMTAASPSKRLRK